MDNTPTSLTGTVRARQSPHRRRQLACDPVHASVPALRGPWRRRHVARRRRARADRPAWQLQLARARLRLPTGARGHTRGARGGLLLRHATLAEIELAEHLAERVPWAASRRFTGSGTEAVMAAVRASRAYTRAI